MFVLNFNTNIYEKSISTLNELLVVVYEFWYL